MEYSKDLFYALAREVAAESAVLLKNENETLPLRKGENVSIFGRIQMNYYKSGTGSGGLVNAPYEVSVPEGLAASGFVKINQNLMSIYKKWTDEHPFDAGTGWAKEPWSQEEMPLTDEIVADAADASDVALIVIGRTAGEAQDSTATAGSYFLTDTEKDMIRKVCSKFQRAAVLLNVGNIIDMNWVEELKVPSVLYVWQGGMEGGNGTADVLTGKVTPCGKLSDTIAYEISDYPSDKNFGDLVENYYQEDIYVGYRYFETFAPDRVLYPFGYGLSYTTFSIEVKAAFAEKCNVVDRDSTVKVEVLVTNTGKVAGKEVVQLYYTAPQGKLGKAVKVLGAFAKTKLLAPDETEVVLLEMPIFRMASYDDSGVTGNKSCWLLEEGAYEIHVGNHVRDTVTALTFEMDKTVVTDVVEEAMTPVKAFTRLKPIKNTNSSCGTGFQEGEEQVPLRTYDLAERICSRCPVEFEKKDDMHYVLADVADGKLSLEEFVAQLNDEELMCLVRGEGMCSPKVTPGTASAFGGLTASLQGYGIPVGCCADGPSGIRMDCGTEATSIPNGTAIACTWNTALTEEMFVCMGKELIENHIDTLLGPGLNIHRHPLNGRNFEYFSEDPYLTGTMAVAEIRGMNQTKATGTIKHFCGNNQEAARHESNSVISERALREVYLKPFEIAIKDGGARSVMTSYNAVNGIWTAGSYDLNTTILRNEWRYEGIVMTDWWADINDDGDIPSRTNTKAMIKAQNDIYMVVEDTLKNSANDNLSQALADGTLTRGELQRSVANLCRFLLATPAFERMQAQPDAEGTAIDKDIDNAFVADELILKDELVVSLYGVDTGRGKRVAFPVYAPEGGSFRLELVTLADAPPLAQLPISIFRGSNLLTTFMVHDTANEWVTMTKEISVKKGHFYLRVMFGMSGTECKTLRLVKI